MFVSLPADDFGSSHRFCAATLVGASHARGDNVTEHGQLAYLGMRQIRDQLNEFQLAKFFTFSRKERGLIDARRTDLYQLGVGLLIGFATAI